MADLIKCLMDANAGELAIKLSRDFTRLIEGVVRRNQKGDMTIKVSLSPSKSDDGSVQMTVKCENKMKIPEQGVHPAIFYVTDDMELTRSDPRQASLYDDIEEEVKRV